jgi:drug/metabolite transporter (DMT)-like permease
VEGDHPLRRALPLLLAAGLCFSTTDATAKWLVQGHALFLVVWARYVGQMVMATPLAWHVAGPGFWRTRHLRIQLARSLCLVTATLCFFGALRFVPLAEGSAITFLAPLFAIVLAYPVLGERPTRARWTAAIAGFCGILLLVRPGSAVFHPAAGLLVLAAASNALYQLLTRRVPGDSAHTTLFYTGIVGTVVLSAGLPFMVEMPDAMPARDVLLLFMVGVLAGVGHLMLIGAYLRAPASLIAPFTYVQMLWATFYGWAIFGQLPDGLSGVGMAVIVASGVALVLHERSRRRP